MDLLELARAVEEKEDIESIWSALVEGLLPLRLEHLIYVTVDENFEAPKLLTTMPDSLWPVLARRLQSIHASQRLGSTSTGLRATTTKPPARAITTSNRWLTSTMVSWTSTVDATWSTSTS